MIFSKNNGKKIFIIVGIIAIVSIITLLYIVKSSSGHRLISVESHTGDILLIRLEDQQGIVDGMNLQTMDYVSVKENSLLELLIDDDKHMVAKAETEFEIVSSGNDNKGYIILLM